MKTNLFAATAVMLFSIAAAAAAAEPAGPIRLVLKDHRFTPDQVTVPAGQRIRIELVNQDSASEEFDSDDLRVERDVTPHGKVVFEVGPLKPGSYAFIGELHADTASGTIKAE